MLWCVVQAVTRSDDEAEPAIAAGVAERPETTSKTAESSLTHSEAAAATEPRKKRRRVQEEDDGSNLQQPSTVVCHLLLLVCLQHPAYKQLLSKCLLTYFYHRCEMFCF